MVIGRPGLGKSWLVRYLADQLFVRGHRVGVVSADMGQASVGPPGCLGLSLAPPWSVVAALWFIGDTTPVGNLLPAVVGTQQLVRRAREEGAETVILDTSGLVEGPLGHVLKYHKALAAGVDRVAALQTGIELESLLTLLHGPCQVDRLRPVAAACDRTPAERRLYREMLFRAHFREARVQTFLPRLLLGPDWLPGPTLGGSPLSRGTLLGLLDAKGFCLSLGLLEEVRPGRVEVFTSFSDGPRVARVQVGKVRLSRTGEQLP